MDSAKKTIIVANWKSNKTESEAKEWLFAMSGLKDLDLSNKEIIICPSFTLLPAMKAYVEEKKLLIKLGTQDISAFGEGAYTGEVNGRQIKELVNYVLIGHSERRKFFHETDEDVIAKFKRLIENNITPILCIADMEQMDRYISMDTLIKNKADDIIFVYEPPSAISKGGQFRAESPEIANQNAGRISQRIGKKVITLYGGSVNIKNAGTFFKSDNLSGGLIGKASLDPKEFYEIIQNT
jgi:triosephosphate isomerase (TIM)